MNLSINQARLRQQSIFSFEWLTQLSSNKCKPKTTCLKDIIVPRKCVTDSKNLFIIQSGNDQTFLLNVNTDNEWLLAFLPFGFVGV